ncbi:hypothetical protein BDN71DRAFT_969559 [Pleurotus eryngii]|uniref:Uncharacterized protein n=1 Tax=Pleurotus eryngii TaxID=5323 RepID=A0A9P5ZVV8_PLEER|nr:hypothetical protein BDN71DRAFT_969559 [Pleurotus eryngii]
MRKFCLTHRQSIMRPDLSSALLYVMLAVWYTGQRWALPRPTSKGSVTMTEYQSCDARGLLGRPPCFSSSIAVRPDSFLTKISTRPSQLEYLGI